MFHRIGAAAYKADLGNITALCAVLGNPQEAYPTIHVAGTNGKGSVSSMLSSILMESGYKVGLFTSPHLKSFTERIRIDGQPITELAVSRFVTQSQATIEALSPSFFEVTTAMAFAYFKEQAVDIAVIEVGMGGRLDSTNILEKPMLSVVTNISLDHTQFLGDTLAKIAAEKAGIAKAGTPMVIGEWLPETKMVFEAKAQALGIPLFFAQSIYQAMRTHADLYGQQFRVAIEGENTSYEDFSCDLPGLYQTRNIQTVLSAVERLQQAGLQIDTSSLKAGIAHAARNSGLRGRMSVLREQPTVIADIGHNEAGIREVLAHINQLTYRQLHIVWGMVEDKDLTKMLALLPRTAHYYYVKPDLPRGMALEMLVPAANAAGLAGEGWPSVQAGYAAALAVAAPDDLIYVGGSTFVVAEVI
jgi:dihydrofolate synthase / folylpolyglutamate synthase